MKNALIVASVASMIDQFNMPNIKLLQELGYHVDVACNFKDGNTCSKERIDALKKNLTFMGIGFYQIEFARNILRLDKHLRAYKQLKRLAERTNYSLMHCHSPIGGFIGRLVFNKYRKDGTKVIYTAHGFHFYKGAPKKNWLLFYPIEKLCSRMTDILITINKEDYELAKSKMKAKQVEYVPGIGVDIKKFAEVNIDRDKKRNDIGVPKDCFLMLSVGELNENKNHESVIRALGSIKDKRVHYAIAGKGDKADELMRIAGELGIGDNVHLLGFRSDIMELFKASDLYVHPSLREGLSVALMEAIASKTPVICSDIRGNIDLVRKENLFNPVDIKSIEDKIRQFMVGDCTSNVQENYEHLMAFDVSAVLYNIKAIYEGK